MSRVVRLTLCIRTGQVLGNAPSFGVPTPWWPDVGPIVDGARDAWGLEVVVLRILDADAPADAMGGSVHYLAEAAGPIPEGLVLERADQLDPADEPLRASWARPGGVEATLAWADAELAAIGRPRTGPSAQIKTWNLSSVLRIPTADGSVWCKSVPQFLAHEGVIIEWVGAREPSLVPPLLAADHGAGTVLLGDVAGEDQWDAPEPVLMEMVHRLVRLQMASSVDVEGLVAAGLPDWRGSVLAERFRLLAGRPSVRGALTQGERTALDALVADAPRRLSELASCGLPDTLVHGDFHPGNWRSDGSSLVLLDWGDSGVGNPLLDLAAFLPRIDAEDVRARVGDAWLAAWRVERPLADPWRAADLIAPVAALRQAMIYRGFLDGIEPDERRYHQADVPDRIREALRLAAGT
jgi:hypothetical protein